MYDFIEWVATVLLVYCASGVYRGWLKIPEAEYALPCNARRVRSLSMQNDPLRACLMIRIKELIY